MATKTITLTGSEVAVTGLDGAHAHIRNDSTDVIYAAKTPGITAGADGVASIPAGKGISIYGISGTIYLFGIGSALVVSNDYTERPFDDSTALGGSTVDDTARTAVGIHSGNAVIHVTADEKTAWNGKAELTDIPSKVQYVNYLGYISDVENILNNSNYNESAYECIITSTEAVLIGLPSCWWQIKYLRHTDNNGFGCQIAFPIDGPDNLPRYRTSIGPTWDEWKMFSDGGNAATLETHPASDFVLKSDYEALEARVAALEGGTT